MKTLFIVLFSFLAINLVGQGINDKITLQISQASLLRVNAGSDLNLSESGFATVGESITVNGGTPEFSYEWVDEVGNRYNEKVPQVQNPGKYWLTVTDQMNCTVVDSLLVRDYGTGFLITPGELNEKVVMDQHQKILDLELSGVQGSLKITVVSIDGKTIYSFSSSDVMHRFNHRIDLTSAKNGIYLFNLQYNGLNSVRKLILH